MNFTSDYETEHCNLQRHSSLTPIYLYIHEVNFDVPRAINSYPQVMVNNDVELRSLNHAIRYDVILFARVGFTGVLVKK